MLAEAKSVEEYQQIKKAEAFCEKTGVSYKDVCYWDLIEEKLVGSKKSKALKFNRLKLIESHPDKYGAFICKRMEGYNNTDYIIEKDFNGSWHCPCQGHCGKQDEQGNHEENECSHILALILFLQNMAFMD